MEEFKKQMREKWQKEAEQQIGQNNRENNPENLYSSPSRENNGESVVEVSNFQTDEEFAKQLQEMEYQNFGVPGTVTDDVVPSPVPQQIEQILPEQNPQFSRPYNFFDRSNPNNPQDLYQKYNFGQRITKIRITFPGGVQTNPKKFPADEFTFRKLGNYAKKTAREMGITNRRHLFEKGGNPRYQFSFWDPYTKKTFDPSELGDKTLNEEFSVPNVNLTIVPKDKAISMKEGSGSIQDGKFIDHALIRTKLRGESPDEKMRYEEEKRRREDERIRREKEEERRRLREVRQKLKLDSEKRSSKNWSGGKNSRYDPDNERNEYIYDDDPYGMNRGSGDPSRRRRVRNMEESTRVKKKNPVSTRGTKKRKRKAKIHRMGDLKRDPKKKKPTRDGF